MSLKSIFSTASGQIVIAQWPNPPLWTALIFLALRLIPHPFAATMSFWGVLLSLVYWAILEITSGVNTFRRMLGTVVLLLQIYKLILLL